MDTLMLENNTLRLEFSRQTGALVSLTAVQTGWKIHDRPHLGLSFRLLLPLPGRRNNPVFGEKQILTALDEDPARRSATFTWDGVASEHGGAQDVRVRTAVALSARQAVFTTTIENRSGLMVENIYSPYLGDLQHPPGEEWFKTFIYHYGSAAEWSLWPTYDNLRGYYGVDYPTQISPWGPGCGAPMSPFILLRGAGQGLYAGVASPSPELVAWHTELRPGYGSSMDARMPEGNSVSGKDIATRFAAVHVPYIQPGETRTLTPVALEAYLGGWQRGVDIYKSWRNTWMKLAAAPAWICQPHAWQQLHINSPEDELRLPFCELVKVGEACARQGVKAIQLVGWNDGGQDRGNPSHDPDPRLGTFAELKEAIARIQALGVRVVLFAKFTWADRSTERFRSDLIRQAIKDPFGDYYLYSGYQYQTATQLLDINTRRLIPMCFLSEDYLQVCDQEFKKLVNLGADGILFDECLHHSPALLCFDQSHGHRYGAPVYANDRKLIQNFSQLSDPFRPDFLFAGEACYDWEFEAYQLSYHRSENKQHIPLMRYLQPHAQLMTAVTGWNDRHMINQCLLYRYIISYEPYNFKGQLEDFPLTLQYGQQMDVLRTDLRDYFWDGEFRDRVGASVRTEDGRPHHPYSVYLNARSGEPGLVVANYDERAPVSVDARLEDGKALAQYRLVDDGAWKPASGKIVIPPASAAVVI